MKKQITKRLFAVIPTLLGVSILSFGLVYLAPGDPAEMLLRQSGGQPTKESMEAFKEKLGFNDPLHVRYADWLWRVVHFDFGKSLSSGEVVITEIASRLPATIKLALAAFVFMLLVSVPVGVLSGLRQNRLFDNLSRLWAIISISIPNYWLGFLLLYFLAMKLKMFRVVGHESLRDLILPAITLGLYMAAVYSRMLRERVIEVLSQDYIKLAYAKGLPVWDIIWRHTLKNTLLPLVTMWGMSFGYLLGGSIIVECVFSWPGVGKFAVDAISNRDFPVLQAYIVMMALIFVSMNLCVDILYQFLDPRIKVGLKRDK